MSLKRFDQLIQYPAGATVLDIKPCNFPMIRNGDLIAVLNVLAHLRHRDNNPNLRFHICDEALSPVVYCRQFYSHVMRTADYLSSEPSGVGISAININVWAYRGLVGDHVLIHNPYLTHNKVVVFPLIDANYNVHRNWPPEMLNEILDMYAARYPDHEKIVCIIKPSHAADEPPITNMRGYTVSHDYLDNLRHMMQAEVFVGGDTGISHLCGSLDRGPYPEYYYHGRYSELQTLPFGYMRRGKIVLY